MEICVSFDSELLFFFFVLYSLRRGDLFNWLDRGNLRQHVLRFRLQRPKHVHVLYVLTGDRWLEREKRNNMSHNGHKADVLFYAR